MPPRIGIATGAVIYVAVFVGCSLVDLPVHGTVWSFAVYLAGGIILSRVVLRRMILHNPDVAALSGCAALTVVPIMRLLVTVTWPVAYPILFLFLAIGKVLA